MVTMPFSSISMLRNGAFLFNASVINLLTPRYCVSRMQARLYN